MIFRESIQIQSSEVAKTKVDRDKHFEMTRLSQLSDTGVDIDLAEVHCSQHQIIENGNNHFIASENKLQTIMKREVNIYVNDNAIREEVVTEDSELLEDVNDDEREEEMERVVPHFIEWQAPIVEWLSPIKEWQVSQSDNIVDLIYFHVNFHDL